MSRPILSLDIQDYTSLPLSTTHIPLHSSRHPLSYPRSEPLPRVSEEFEDNSPGKPNQSNNNTPSRGQRSGFDPSQSPSPIKSPPAVAHFNPSHRSTYESLPGGHSGPGDRYSGSSSYTQSSSSMASTIVGAGYGAPSLPTSVTSSPSTMVGNFPPLSKTFGSVGERGHNDYNSSHGLAAPVEIHLKDQQPLAPRHYRNVTSPPLPLTSPPQSLGSNSPRSNPRSPSSGHRYIPYNPGQATPSYGDEKGKTTPRLNTKIPNARFSGSEVAAAGMRAAEGMANGGHFNSRLSGMGSRVGEEQQRINIWDQQGRDDHERGFQNLKEEEGTVGTNSGGENQYDQEGGAPSPFNIRSFSFPAVPDSESDSATDVVSPSSLRQSEIGSSGTEGNGGVAERGLHGMGQAKSMPLMRVVSGNSNPSTHPWKQSRQGNTGSTSTTSPTASGSSYGAQPLPPLTTDYTTGPQSLANYQRYASQHQHQPRSISASTNASASRSLQRVAGHLDTRSFSSNTSNASSATPGQHPFSTTSSVTGSRYSTDITSSTQQPASHHSYGTQQGIANRQSILQQFAVSGSMVDVMPSEGVVNTSNPISVVVSPERQQGTPTHPVALVSHEDTQGEETCPICVESLNASYRLPGEKAHIVPKCGHALHEACFTEVYGPMPKGPRASSVNLGVCGVCRGEMRMEDEDDGFGPPTKGSGSELIVRCVV